MILDVGCGSDWLGDVNTDIQRYCPTPNFLKSTALKLPFKSDCFSEVVCRQMIEHNADPFKVLMELVRVSNNVIVVETMDYKGELCFSKKNREWFKQNHVSKLSFGWFRVAAKVLNCQITKEYVITWRGIPHNYVPVFQVPAEIGVRMIKLD